MAEPAYAASIPGYLIVFGSRDAEGLAFEHGCVAPLPPALPLFWNHDRTRPIGRAHRFEQTMRGLRCTVEIAAVADGYAALSQIRAGHCLGLSPGWRILWQQRRWLRRGYRMRRVDLHEVSLTPNPRFPGAGLSIPRSN